MTQWGVRHRDLLSLSVSLPILDPTLHPPPKLTNFWLLSLLLGKRREQAQNPLNLVNPLFLRKMLANFIK